MVLPKTCKQSGIEVVSLYMPQLRDHLTLPESTFADVKRLVKEMGGQTNASCQFLKVTSSPVVKEGTALDDIEMRGLLAEMNDNS